MNVAQQKLHTVPYKPHEHPSTVRIATQDDHLEIWRMFLQAHNENGLFPLAPQKVDFYLTRALNPQAIPPGDMGPRGVVGVIGGKELEALAFIILSEFWYSDKMHIEELIVYVDPQYRIYPHAKALLRWMKQQAEQTKLKLFTGIVSNQRTVAKCRLYGMMLPKTGEFFVYDGASVTAASSMAA